MKKISALRIILITSIIGVIAYISYNYFIKEIILNNSDQKIEVLELQSDKLYSLSKHMDQLDIYQLELEVKGNSSEILEISYGETTKGLERTIMLKKGEIDFVDLTDWYSDSCYLIIKENKGAKVNLEIKYRFIGSAH